MLPLRDIAHRARQPPHALVDLLRGECAERQAQEPLAVGRVREEAAPIAEAEADLGRASLQRLARHACREVHRQEETAIRLDPTRVGQVFAERITGGLQARASAC